MTEAETAWVAGLLEGEGFFGNYQYAHGGRKRACHWCISCAMCDRDVLEKLCGFLGLGRVQDPRKPQKPHHKPAWRWAIRKRKDVLEVCEAILPYMGQRRSKRIREILQAMKDHPPRTGPRWEHGSRQGYSKGCRCESCVDTQHRYFRDYTKRKRRQAAQSLVGAVAPLEPPSYAVCNEGVC